MARLWRSVDVDCVGEARGAGAVCNARDPRDGDGADLLSRVLLGAGREAEAVKELGDLVDLLDRGGVLEKREFTE